MHNHFVSIVRGHECKTTAWSGGATTELLIDPPGASYQERNFSWRLSVATVDDPESIFTALPEVKRILLLLRGQVRLVHEGHYETALRPFTQDTFWGDWRTHCYGRATDFNLMTRTPYRGSVAPLFLTGQEPQRLTFDQDITGETGILVLYVWQGGLTVSVDGRNYRLRAGDVCRIEAGQGETPSVILVNRDRKPAKGVITTIYKERKDG
ncbi:HutD/Ves family protein [Propionispora vibrioides]|uniref:HutD protein n=1 Tax=Propionispora vibrioides TaxID=112903 RepID=A0A1H8XG10_9FIRM|nr:HutD family protein [Propionispora vibrioides]SEP38667.1 HutD protein [Propionispora vibrioides]